MKIPAMNDENVARVVVTTMELPPKGVWEQHCAGCHYIYEMKDGSKIIVQVAELVPLAEPRIVSEEDGQPI